MIPKNMHINISKACSLEIITICEDFLIKVLIFTILSYPFSLRYFSNLLTVDEKNFSSLIYFKLSTFNLRYL